MSTQEHDTMEQSDHHQLLKYEERITLQDVKKHIIGPILSFLFHVALFVFLAQMVITPARKENKTGTAEVVELKPLDPDFKLNDIDPVVNEEPDSPDFNLDTPLPQVSSPNVPSMETSSLDIHEVTIEDIPELVLKKNNSALIAMMPKNHIGWLGKGGLKGQLAKNKGTLQAERAVRKSLDWLQANQNADGSWGKAKSNQPVFTALATLAFLGHGETTLSQKYGDTVLKAVKRLLAYGNDFIKHRRRYIAGPSYTHPIIVYALAETYSLIKTPQLKKILAHAVKPLINNINKDGYYYYGYDNRIREKYKTPLHRDPYTGRYPEKKPPKIEYVHSDLTFSVWNYQALKAIYVAGLESEEIYNTIQKAIKGLKKADIGYKTSDYTLTCLGAFCLGILGEDSSIEAKRCYKFIKTFNPKMIKTCSWKGNKELQKKYPQAFNWAIYTWYYQTMVLFQLTKGKKNSTWARWSKAFSTAFTREQQQDGSFLSPAQKYGHSLKPGTAAEWDKVSQFKHPLDLSLYCTVFSTLTLEVYYRYLPTYESLAKPKVTLKGFNDTEFDDLLEKI